MAALTVAKLVDPTVLELTIAWKGMRTVVWWGAVKADSMV